MKKTFITYGNELYSNSIVRVCKEAENTKRFDVIKSYTDKDLPSFITNYPLFKCKRGGGYWIWKPYIILKTLQELEDENDLVVYCDAGCRLYDDKEWDKWFDIMQSHNAILFKNGAINKNWTRKIMFEAYKEKLPFLKNMHQIQATLIITNKNAMPLIKTWLDIMLNNPDFVRDVTPEEMKNEDSCFVENRHDQTALSFAGWLWSKRINAKMLWQNIESRHFEGQAVFAARMSNKGTRSKENIFEKRYETLAKKIIIYPYRNMRNWFWNTLNHI